MKNWLSLLFLALFGLFFNSAGAEQINFSVIKNPFRFSTYFELIGKNGYEGRVIKDSFHLRTTYDLYDKEGWYESQGICRAMSLGALYTWAKEIDIYDNQGLKIGFIDGKAFTTANARYDFYDKQECYAAAAYLDYNCQGFTITDPSGMTIAFLKRKPDHNEEQDWEMNIFKPEVVDLRLLKIFAAFVVDFQDSFLP